MSYITFIAALYSVMLSAMDPTTIVVTGERASGSSTVINMLIKRITGIEHFVPMGFGGTTVYPIDIHIVSSTVNEPVKVEMHALTPEEAEEAYWSWRKNGSNTTVTDELLFKKHQKLMGLDVNYYKQIIRDMLKTDLANFYLLWSIGQRGLCGCRDHADMLLAFNKVHDSGAMLSFDALNQLEGFESSSHEKIILQYLKNDITTCYSDYRAGNKNAFDDFMCSPTCKRKTLNFEELKDKLVEAGAPFRVVGIDFDNNAFVEKVLAEYWRWHAGTRATNQRNITSVSMGDLICFGFENPALELLHEKISQDSEENRKRVKEYFEKVQKKQTFVFNQKNININDYVIDDVLRYLEDNIDVRDASNIEKRVPLVKKAMVTISVPYHIKPLRIIELSRYTKEWNLSSENFLDAVFQQADIPLNDIKKAFYIVTVKPRNKTDWYALDEGRCGAKFYYSYDGTINILKALNNKFKDNFINQVSIVYNVQEYAWGQERYYSPKKTREILEHKYSEIAALSYDVFVGHGEREQKTDRLIALLQRTGLSSYFNPM